MISVSSALGKAVAQLGDPKIMRVLVKTILLTGAIFAAAGATMMFALIGAVAQYQTDFGPELAAIFAILATVLGAWLLFRIVALAVLQFFADEVVRAVEDRHFPAAVQRMRTLGWREELANSWASIARAIGVNLIALIVAIPFFFTAIGPAIVFWAANGWLLGRELQDMVWLRHRHTPGDPAPLGWFERFALGGIITAMLAIPFINLLAPIIGAASATHLVHGRLTPGKAGATNAA